MNEFNKVMEFMGFSVNLYTTTVPTYYGGLTAMYLYREKSDQNVVIVEADITKPAIIPHDMEFKHYNAGVHIAAFMLPNWLKEMENE